MVIITRRKPRRFEGFTQSEIVKLLRKEKNMKFTDLRQRLQISKPVLSKHLSKLEKQKVIESQKKGREKHYMLRSYALKIPERRIDVFSSNYNDYSMDNLLATTEYNSLEELFSKFTKKMNAIYLYTLLKSMETGRNWQRAIDMKQFSNIILLLITDFLYSDKKPDELSELIVESNEDLFEKIKPFIMKKNIRNKLKQLYETVQSLYPEETLIMEMSYKRPKSYWTDALKS